MLLVSGGSNPDFFCPHVPKGHCVLSLLSASYTKCDTCARKAAKNIIFSLHALVHNENFADELQSFEVKKKKTLINGPGWKKRSSLKLEEQTKSCCFLF